MSTNYLKFFYIRTNQTILFSTKIILRIDLFLLSGWPHFAARYLLNVNFSELVKLGLLYFKITKFINLGKKLRQLRTVRNSAYNL